MQWASIVIIFFLVSCKSTIQVEKNCRKRTQIETVLVRPLRFSETMFYNHPKWNDEEHSYKFEFVENPKNEIPIGKKITLLDNTYFKCNLGFWTPWRSIIYEHSNIEFDGWIEILKLTSDRAVVNHEVVAVWPESRKIIFAGRIELNRKNSQNPIQN